MFSAMKHRTGERRPERPRTDKGENCMFFIVLWLRVQGFRLQETHKCSCSLGTEQEGLLVPNKRQGRERGCILLGSQFFRKPADNENKMPRFWK